MTITPQYLSGSVSGQAISIAGVTINAATLIHTSTNTALTMDNVHLSISNTSSSTYACVLEWGSTGAQQIVTVSPSGVVSVPFAFLSGGLSISAFSGAANVLFITGRCYRESP